MTFQNSVIRKRVLNVKERDVIYEYFNSLGLSFTDADNFMISLNSLIREAHRPDTFYCTIGIVSKVTLYLDGILSYCVRLNGHTSFVSFDRFCAYIYRLIIIH